MVVETAVKPFLQWLPWALLDWLMVVVVLTVVVVMFVWLWGALRHGPVAAARTVGRTFLSGLLDAVAISPGRVLALSWLAIKEAFRRRVIVVVAVFVLLLLFAGWFLDPGSMYPARLYLSFVLTATTYLMLSLTLFLSALSLPADIKNRTLHTITTKPVRPSEIVLGRILGFAVVGSILLAAMGVVSCVFVERGLAHSHSLVQDDLSPLPSPDGEATKAKKGRTNRQNNHTHNVYVNSKGIPRLETNKGHTHSITATELDEKAKGKTDEKFVYRIGRERGMLTARVPVYGELRFKDRNGKDSEKGINVGDEWTYRSYIQGGTMSAAIWTFEGVTPQKFPKGLPLEMTIEVFRTYKGDTSDPEGIPGIMGGLSLRNPQTGVRSKELSFTAKEYTTDSQFIPRELEPAEQEADFSEDDDLFSSAAKDDASLDLFEDLVHDGKVEVWLTCLPNAQLFGAAEADLYVRAEDTSFRANFAKGYLGIWLQMVLVIAIGVMFGTFLSGPVAVLATAGTLLTALPVVSNFMVELSLGKTYGGGPFESLIRLLTQRNLTSELEPGLQTTVAKEADKVIQGGLNLISHALPNLGNYGFSDYVAHGFNISGDALLTASVRGFAFVLPLFIAGYFFLKTREVAR